MKREAPAIDFERSMGPWIGKTVKIIDYYLHEAMARHGLDLSKEQMIVLKKLHDKDGLNQRQLASLTYRDKSSLARLLTTMEGKEYIRKQQSKADKRSNEVFLTRKGRAIFRQSQPVIKKVLTVMEKGISEEEKQTMIGLLKRIQFNLAKKTEKL